MKANSFLFGCLFISFFAGCSKELSMKLPKESSKLVLNCLLIAGEPIVAQVSHTAPVISGEVMYINHAAVELWEGDKYIKQMIYSKDGEYTSNVAAQAGKSYTLKVTVSGYEQVEGTDSVPLSVDIIDAKSGWGAHPYIQAGEVQYYDDYSLVFKDDPLHENYYELVFLGQQRYSDSTYLIGVASICRIPDPVIEAEGLINFFPESYGFSDQQNNGKEFSIEMSFSGGVSSLFTQPLINGTDGNYTILRSTSNNYYNFKKSWYVHRYNQQYSSSIVEMIYEGLTGDPVPLYTNIKNGYGIVVAYSQVYLKTKYTHNAKK